MKKTLLALAICILATCASAVAQTGQDSLVVALKPCVVYPAHALIGGTTTNFKIRGTCNVPTAATAVFAQVIVTSPSSAGSGFLWAYSTLTPLIPQFHYSTVQDADGRALVALCDPEPECGFADVSLKPTTTATVTVVVEGYLKPH